jgi:hypothetical protein
MCTNAIALAECGLHDAGKDRWLADDLYARTNAAGHPTAKKASEWLADDLYARYEDAGHQTALKERNRVIADDPNARAEHRTAFTAKDIIFVDDLNARFEAAVHQWL